MSTGEVVRAWRPPVPGLREVLQARFRTHVYPRHAHDVWTILVVDTGDIRYALDGTARRADAATVTILPPHVAHDGRPGPSGTFVKRVLYVDDTLLDTGLVGPAVDAAGIADPGLRRSVRAAHRTLRVFDDPLRAESLLTLALERLVAHLRRGHGRAPVQQRTDAIAEATRALLDEHLATGISLAAMAGEIGVSRGHVVRSFTATFGIAPHAYLTSRRIGKARALLLDGWDAGAVAVEVGFYDQSHLTRHFRRHVGTTPGSFARSRGALVELRGIEPLASSMRPRRSTN